MANKLNVLVGATLDSNVTEDLNVELQKIEGHLRKLNLKASFDEEFQTIVNQLNIAFSNVDTKKLTSNIVSAFEQNAKSVSNFGQASEKAVGKIVSKTVDLQGNLRQTKETVDDLANGLKQVAKINFDEYGEVSGGTVTTTDKSGSLFLKEKEKIVENLISSYAKLENAEKRLMNGFDKAWQPAFIKEFSNELSKIETIINNENTSLEKLRETAKSLKNIDANIDIRTNIDEKATAKINQINDNFEIKAIRLRSLYGDLFDENEFLEIQQKYLPRIENELEKTEVNAKTVEKYLRDWQNDISKAEAKLSATNKELKTAKKETELLNNSLGRFVEFYWFGQAFHGIKNGVTEIVSAITDIDTAMIELKKVTDETAFTYENFLDGSAEKASRLGVSINDYISSVTEFARMGYSFSEAQIVAETANVMQTVSENLSADQSAEYLISIMSAFNIEAEKSLDIVDKLNNISNNFAITTDGLGEALKRSSSSMRVANNSLDETIALITAANIITQNPESVGNALKTVSMRIRGTKIEEDEDGDSVVSAGALRNLILDKTGVDILDEVNNEFKSTYQILLEISRVWQDLDGMTKSSLLEKIAGKHRASIVANILNDTETLEEAYNKVLNSEGSAMEEFQKRTESITYALNELKVAWQEFSLNAIETDTILYAIEQLENLLNTVSKIGLVELVSTSAGAFGSLFAINKIVPFLKAEGLKEAGETVKILGENFKVAETAAGKFSLKNKELSHGLAGFINIAKALSKSLGKTVVAGAAFYALTNVILKTIDAIDNYKHKTEKLNEAVNQTKTKLSELNEELAVLKENTNLTDGEQKRIEILEEQIELQEKVLELKKKQADESLINDVSGYFNKSNKNSVVGFEINNDFEEKIKKAKKSVDEYSKALQYLENNNEIYEERDKKLSEYMKNVVVYQDEITNLGKKMQKYVQTQENLPTYYEEAANAISDLLPYRQSLNEIINTGTELQKARARTLLAELDVMLYESKVVLGLADSFESATKKYIEFSDKAEKIDNIIKGIGKNGNILTFENMEKLKEVFSEEDYKIIAEIIEENSDKIAEGYKLEEDAIYELIAAKNELEEKSIKANKNRVEAEINEIDKTIKAYQLENEALISIYTTLEKARTDVAAPQFHGLAHLPNLDRDYKEYEEAIRKREELQLKLAQINKELEDLDNNVGGSTNNSSSSKDGLNNKISTWNEYIHALEKAAEEIERYEKKVKLAEAKLNLNQSNENRNLTVIEEEQRLYAELINAKKQYYKIVNDTLYSQMQQLDVLAEQAAIASGININALKDMTDVEIDKHIEFNLDADDDNDQAVIKLLEGFKALKNSVQENHVLWYELKEDIAKTEFDSISVRIDFQNDFLDQFDEARQNSEKLLDIFEEMENTEENRLTIVQSLVDSYETELNSAMELHKSNAQTMLNLIRENKENTSEYQALVKQNISLEEHMLDNIQSEFL